MTILDTRAPGRATPTTLSWSNPVADLWVASNDGEYAGIIEFVDGHFIVRSQTGTVVAISVNIPAGQRVLAAHVASLPLPATVRLLDDLSGTPRHPFSEMRRQPGYVRATHNVA